MTTSPAELQAIRERFMSRPVRTNSYTTYGESNADCKALLALYDAQSDEVRRLREALNYQRLQVILMHKEGSLRQETMEHLRDRIDAALGSQP